MFSDTSCVKNLVDQAVSQGYAPTTVQQYLNDYPVDESDIVAVCCCPAVPGRFQPYVHTHWCVCAWCEQVEDGAWVNADSDFGSPQCINWNWPLLPKDVAYPGDFDIPNGWAIRERSWAIITAAQNAVETAEAMAGGVDIAQVQSPGPDATNAEKAWNTFLPSQTSGCVIVWVPMGVCVVVEMRVLTCDLTSPRYMYYGNVLDLPVKPTVAANCTLPLQLELHTL